MISFVDCTVWGINNEQGPFYNQILYFIINNLIIQFSKKNQFKHNRFICYKVLLMKYHDIFL